MSASSFRLVVVETPFAGKGATEVERKRDEAVKRAYLRACLHDCLRRGEAPFASHAIYTQPGVIDDDDADERELGIAAGFAWRAAADFTVFYTDLGWSSGMMAGKEDAERIMQRIVERSLSNDALEPVLALRERVRSWDSTHGNDDALWVPGDEW